jgi:magnesium transporter
MIVDCAVYEEGRRHGGSLELHEALERCRGDEAFAWIGLYEPSEDEFDSVRREFGLHELAVEDAINAHQRPKLEVYDDTLFIVLKTARYVDSEEIVELGEILVFLGASFIITVRHGEGTALHDVRERVESRPDLMRCGPGAVLHAIVDRVVDDYAPAIEGLREDIEEVEADVFSPERGSSARRIYLLKREVLELTRATAPLVEPVAALAAGRYALVHENVHPYFRDVGDHLVRLNEQLEGFRDLLTSVLTANLSQVTVQQNEDVRKISAVVAIIAVPTMIAGIYGMNFDHMPELGWQYGYPLVLGVMAAVCLALFRYFKRVGWL